MKARRWIITIIVIGALVGGFFFLRNMRAERDLAEATENLQTEKAEVGSLVATVGATGTVRANQTGIVSWQTSGMIEAVNFGLGDEVAAGDVMASLKQTSLAQNLILAQADLVSAEKALENLLDSIDDLSLALAEKEIADARDQLQRAEDSLEDLTYYGEEDDIEKSYKKLIAAQRDMDKAEDLWEKYKTKKSSYKYYQAYNGLNEAREAYRIAFTNYNYLTGGSVDEIDLAQAEANLLVAQERLTAAEDNLAELQAGVDQADITAAETRIAAAEASLESAWIEAPFSGTITQSDLLPGDQVGMGTMAFRVDDLSRLLVDVEISEVDINRVQIGQAVTLTFDAILASEYTGKVIEVSPVGSLVAGVVNFKVTVELIDADELVRPAMTAAVSIVVSELDNVLLVPNRAVRVVDGLRVVYIMKSGEMEMVEVELGSSADLYSEIVGGDLQAGDIVILNPPAMMFSTDGPPSFMMGR